MHDELIDDKLGFCFYCYKTCLGFYCNYSGYCGFTFLGLDAFSIFTAATSAVYWVLLFLLGDGLHSVIVFELLGRLDGDKIVQNCLQSDLDISTMF